MPGESHRPQASTPLAIPVRRAHPGRTGARHRPKAGFQPRTVPAWWAEAPRPQAGRPLLGVLAEGTEAPHSKGAVATRRLRRVGPAGRPPAAVGPAPAGGGMPGVALRGSGGEESWRDTGRGGRNGTPVGEPPRLIVAVPLLASRSEEGRRDTCRGGESCRADTGRCRGGATRPLARRRGRGRPTGMPGESHRPQASTPLAIPVRRAHPGRTGARHRPKAGFQPRTVPAWWAEAPCPQAGRPLLGGLARVNPRLPLTRGLRVWRLGPPSQG